MLLDDEKNMNEFKKVIMSKIKVDFDKLFKPF